MKPAPGLFDLVLVVGVHGPGQTVLAVIGNLDRLIVVYGLDHGQDGSKDSSRPALVHVLLRSGMKDPRHHLAKVAYGTLLERRPENDEISQVCRKLARSVFEALEDGCLPLVLGGDHSLAAGSVAGSASFHRGRGEKIGLIWIDAHADMNLPETSPSRNVHGMPLAAIVGLGPPELGEIEGFSPKVDPANVTVIGARSIDRRERDNVERSGVRVITMKELDMRRMNGAMEKALDRAVQGTVGFH